MGDHFGILLDHRITAFPYNIFEDPLYVGTVMMYYGIALEHASLIGLLLAMCVNISYVGAALAERPYTAKIYTEAAAKKRTKSQ